MKPREEFKMKLNDNIENTEIEEKVEARDAKASIEQVPVIKPPKKPVVAKAEIPVTEENLDKLIPQWKAQYGKIFKNNIDDNEFVIWRPIKRKEYKELLNEGADVDLMDKQEDIAKLAVLYPADAETLIDSRAGLATVLSEEILKYSGFEISETQSL
jgi:hypothetical protein